MNWLALLDRIGAERTDADLEALMVLQRQALLHLPFENLDIHLGRPIILDPEAVFRKVVTDGRGGFCYELNECFYRCLVELGYEVERLEARVEMGGAGAPFDHQVTLVHHDGVRWMADVDMGDSTMVPLNLDDRDAQTDGRSGYRVDESGEFLEIFRQFQADEWSKMLILNTTPQPWEGFAGRCCWQQTAADSVFLHKRMCTLATPDGRVTLSGNTLKRTGADSSETLIAESDYTNVLDAQFGIQLSSPDWSRPLEGR